MKKLIFLRTVHRANSVSNAVRTDIGRRVEVVALLELPCHCLAARTRNNRYCHRDRGPNYD